MGSPPDVVALLVLCPAIVIANSIVLYIIYKRNLHFEVRYRFIANLAIGDLVSGVIGYPGVALVRAFQDQLPVPVCLCVTTFISTSLGCAILNLVALSVNQFLAVRYPLWYNSNVTDNRIRMSLASVWLFSLFIGLLPLLGMNRLAEHEKCGIQQLAPSYLLVLAIVLYYIPLILTVCLSICVYLILRRHLRMIAIQVAVVQPVNPVGGPEVDQQQRTIAGISILILVFAIIHTPFFLMCTVAAFSPSALDWYRPTAIIMAFGNLTNPLVYAFRSKRFREAFLKFCQGCMRSNQVAPQG